MHNNSEITVDDIKCVITRTGRIPLGQVTLYKVLYEHTEGLPVTQLANLLQPPQRKHINALTSLSGILSAISRRVNETEKFKSYKPGHELFIEFSVVNGQRFCYMKQIARSALEELPDLFEVTQLPLEQVFEKFDKVSQGLVVTVRC